ncbi:2919_t:CDS:2 [Entrophospora sp. SA101]|nr:2919_t:CDS:2 [Entrophospora sp. SA101]CAJ0847254.1 638_t:CDS:2 [Entrophospora sp. SA101]
MTESFVPSLEQIKEIQSSGIPETTKKIQLSGLYINNDKLVDNSNSNCNKRMGGINKIDKHYSNKPFKRPKLLDSTNNYDNRKTVIKKISYKNCNEELDNASNATPTVTNAINNPKLN